MRRRVLPVRLNGCNSSDPDGTNPAFRWDFSDVETKAAGCETTRRYDRPGTYTARLTVTDRSGALNGTAQDTVAIRINAPPVASAGPDILSGGTVIDFDGSASADADGDPLTFRWDFGDGSPGWRRSAGYAYLCGGRQLSGVADGG